MESQDRIKSALSEVETKIKLGQDKLKVMASDVEAQLKDNPWPIVAGVAVGCVLLGFILGFSKKH